MARAPAEGKAITWRSQLQFGRFAYTKPQPGSQDYGLAPC